MANARFDLYLKKSSSDAAGVTDCPFSQKVNMYAHLKVPDFANNVNIILINLGDKPASFLAVNPGGKVPVLIDHKTGKCIPDSDAITQYIHECFPEPDLGQGYKGPAIEATSSIFGRFVHLLKGKDPDAITALKDGVTEELKKLEAYLKSTQHNGTFLLNDGLSEIDCGILPKLKHLQVAAKHFQDYTVPGELSAVIEYMKRGFETTMFQNTGVPDSDIIAGWMLHLT